MYNIVLNIRLKFMKKVYLNMESVKWFFVILRTGSRIKSGMTEGEDFSVTSFLRKDKVENWIPACAGMTVWGGNDI